MLLAFFLYFVFSRFAVARHGGITKFSCVPHLQRLQSFISSILASSLSQQFVKGPQSETTNTHNSPTKGELAPNVFGMWKERKMNPPFKRASGLGIEPITLPLNDMFLIVLVLLSCFLHLLNQTQQLVDFAHMDSDTY